MRNIRRLVSFFRFIRACSTRPHFNEFAYRTHDCGELRSSHIGQTVTLCGWLQYLRSNRFLALRDAYGLTQAIILHNSSKIMSETVENLHLESVLKIRGSVAARPEKDKNPKMDTGDIEILVEDLEVLNNCRPNLPFEVKKYNIVQDDAVKMKHRYLYLRHEKMQKILRLRSDIISKMRRFLTDYAGFVDVETPTLFRRTPGGAAEFLVPTRYPGQFYSLPQSPQQFKQLLMVGGIDRYFQIARCYRDEGIKHDRQPEFTQMDLELSFTTQNDILRLIEGLLEYSWPKELLGKLDIPFLVMTHHDVMSTYGTDKPDLRYELTLNDVTDWFSEANQGPFSAYERQRVADWSIQMIVSQSGSKQVTKGVTDTWKQLLEQNSFAERFSVMKLQTDAKLSGSLAKFVPETARREILAKILSDSQSLAIFSWGEKRKVQQTLGFLRTKLAETLELQNPQEFKFLWVTDFPLFSKDDQGNFESEHHPFTAPVSRHENLILEHPEKVTGQHYDLVLNGVELGGGSIRIHDSKMQKYVLENILKEDPTGMQHLLDALEMGAPPHGGIALGLDRYMAILCNMASIKDVIAFPKNWEGRDTMSGAPAPPTPDELARYHVKVVDEEKV